MAKVTLALIRLWLSLVVLGALIPEGQLSALASAPRGTIAYVHRNPAGVEEIHLIEPDGSRDRLLFSTKKPLAPQIMDIQQLAWKPDASELAFTSSHEDVCSLFKADIYAIRPDGTGYRRVSAPPACGSRAGIPTGTVRVPLENFTIESGPFTIYFEGAPAPVQVSLAPHTSTTVTFHNVADYGGRKQTAVAIYGEVRCFYPGANVDVQPGQTVETGVLAIRTGLQHYGFQWPAYLPDGHKIASIFNKGDLYQVASHNQTLGEVGDKRAFSMPMSSDFLAWGPTSALAGQFLYEGWVDSDTIFLGKIGDSAGQAIMTIDPTRIGKSLLGLAWLPDGSGFLYSFSEMVNWVDKADLWEYSFATGQSRRVTNVPHGFARRMAISPDGQKIVYEYQPSGYWYQENPAIDLWMVNRDGSGRTLFVTGGRAPAWSRQDVPDPIVFDQKLSLPLILRR
jgi:hypothetical protein